MGFGVTLDFLGIFQNKITPRKINMEPENTPLEEENHLPNSKASFLGSSR